VDGGGSLQEGAVLSFPGHEAVATAGVAMLLCFDHLIHIIEITFGVIMRIAFLGSGQMGSAVARHLIKAGHELTVWNRTAAHADQFTQKRRKGRAQSQRGSDGM
jgi:hypothetical protein